MNSPAIVFLHGLGVSSWMWSDQVDHLSGRFQCITVDLPGMGSNRDTSWRSMAHSAAAVAEVIETLPQRRAHVVGLSLGGHVAAELLATRPELVDRVVISGITTAPLPATLTNRLIIGLGGFIMRQPLLSRLYGLAMRMPKQARDAMAADARALNARTTELVYAEIVPYRLPDLGEGAERVLAVAGDAEVPAVTDGLAVFAAAGATTAIVPDAHHTWNAEHPELFSAMIADWVTDQRVTAGLKAQ